MAGDSLSDADWRSLVDRLGGEAALEASARQTGGFVRAREIKSAVDLLRLVLAYCLGERGLRLTTAWAASVGLVDVSNVALLYRLQRCAEWLTHLVGVSLSRGLPRPAQGRLIRLIDATSVAKAAGQERGKTHLWRIHSAFELPTERFGAFELTDEAGGERIDRIAVEPGEIRIGDRAYLQPERIAAVLQQGADVLVRAPWRNARWLSQAGEAIDLAAEFANTAGDVIDRPIWIGRKQGSPALALRLVAVRKPAQAAAEARRKARRDAQREQRRLSEATLAMADWVILVTSLAPEAFTTDDILALYRLRWRIELAFKRLKSIVGLRPPPGRHPRSARAWLLAHLLMILWLEPLIDEFEDSPRLPAAA